MAAEQNENNPKDQCRSVLGSYALGELLGRIKNGTFGAIINDWKWIAAYTRRYRGAVAAYTLMGIMSASFALVSAVASKYTIDIITGQDKDRFWFVIAVMLLSTAISLALRSALSRISAKVSIRVNNDIQAEIFDNVIRADWNELHGFADGDILNRINSDAYTVASNAISWLPDLIISSYTFIITLLVILYYDAIMALLALSSAPFLVLFSRRLLAKMRSHGERAREINSKLMAFEANTLNNIDSIKSFGITGRQSQRLRTLQQEYKTASLEYNGFSIKVEAALSLLGSAVQMAAFCYCLYLLWNNKILYGTMTLFLSQGARLSSSFNSLIKTVPAFLNGSISAQRIRELIDLPPEDAGAQGTALRADKGLSVKLKDVAFAYNNGGNVLGGVNMAAAPGEIVAIIGPSGEGKTTLLRLMLALIQPQSGSAALYDAYGNAEKINAGHRGFFSYVPQGNTLIAGTIADNLKMVNEAASEADIEAALKAADAWDFVSKMEKGIYSSVGEHGHGLSEGQAQRIAIARAALRAAPIMLFDEATSALDAQTEQLVLQSIMRAHPNKTCIVTTHRPSVITMCSRAYKVNGTALEEISIPAQNKN